MTSLRWDATASRATTTSRAGSNRRWTPAAGHHGQRLGFTLIELALVAAVLASLLAMSVPRFAAGIQRLRGEHAATEMAQLLRLARARAITEAHPVVWAWQPDDRRAVLEDVSADGSRAPAEGRAYQSRTVPEAWRVECRVDETTAEEIAFAPDGTAQPATVIFRHARNRTGFQISVDEATGQSQINPWTAAR